MSRIISHIESRDINGRIIRHYTFIRLKCVTHPDLSLNPYDFLLRYGFIVPVTTDYCLMHNSCNKLKFRKFGARIEIYITYLNSSNSSHYV